MVRSYAVHNEDLFVAEGESEMDPIRLPLCVSESYSRNCQELYSLPHEWHIPTISSECQKARTGPEYDSLMNDKDFQDAIILNIREP
ncbi:uncharacterized protein FFNC_15596 [Fusarium fujikuroi]|nr:uncharacterized protein FFNC_15596 [Fusarium fujikuroi]